MEEDVIQAEYQYWLARVEIEMPTPDSRTLAQLGRVAYLLSKQGDSDELPEPR